MTELEKPPAELKKRKLSLRQRQQPKTALGQWGEAQASTFLLNQGYIIIATNLYSTFGEIDIVAVDNQQQQLVFCEVKTRSSNWYGDPSLAVNFHKLSNLRKVSQMYLRTYPTKMCYRFDVITITPKQIYHHKNVTI